MGGERAIAFCDSSFADFALRNSLALILLTAWIIVLWITRQHDRREGKREDV